MAAGTIVHGDGALSGRSPWARLPDRALKWTLTGIAAAILVLIAFFFVRLYLEARPVFSQVGLLDYTFGDAWVPSQDAFGALPLLIGSVITAAIALALGVPVAVATALFICELCPARL